MQPPSWMKRLSPVDGCAALIAVAAIAGVVWSPKLTNAVAKATGAMEPVEVSVDVGNLVSADPEGLLQAIREEGQLSFVVRNQPAGSVRLINVEVIQPKLFSVQPDGLVVQAENPNPSPRLYVRFQLEAEAKRSPSGIVVGGTKIKVGVPVELEGSRYRVVGVVSGVRQS